MEQQQFINMEDDSKDKKYFTIVPNYVLNHSAAIDQSVYIQMKRLTEEEGRDICYPSVGYLMKQLKVGKIVLKKSIKYLINNKWIEDKGKRKIKTAGGYQWVQCYKVNDIWKLNMDYYQGGDRQPPLPQTKGGTDLIKEGTIACTQEEHIKEELYNVATPSVAGKEINDLIELFKPINPSYERLFRNKTQRACLERMVKKHSKEKIEWVLNILPKTNQIKYAPTITTPLQLEDKLGLLLAFIQREKNREPKFIKI